MGLDVVGSEIDLKLDYALFRHVQIADGRRWLDFNYFEKEEDSSVKVQFRGPFVGLNIILKHSLAIRYRLILLKAVIWPPL